MITEITIGFIGGIIFSIIVIKPHKDNPNSMINKIKRTKKIWSSDK